VWAPDGGWEVPPGRHDLGQLGRLCGERRASPVGIALDIWCDSIGEAESHSWAAEPPDTPDQANTLNADILSFVRSVAGAEELLPSCMDWITAVTKVAVLLRSGNIMKEFRSASRPDTPGLVSLDATAESILVLESLVHESAHHYFYLAESHEPLVDPEHDGTYRSPLRRDRRPLRGIFLAFHALAFIGALYVDAAEAGYVGSAEYQEDRVNLRSMLDDAGETMSSNRRHLSEAGGRLLDATAKVAEYARAR
jgi:HEXXH motif-containing protein